MATPDYSKRLAAAKKIDSENEANSKELGKQIEQGVKRAREIADALTYGLEDFDKSVEASMDEMEAWYEIAGKIVPLQKEQKDALKAKDKAKVKELEVEIAKLHAKATGIEKTVQKSLKDANDHKNDAINMIKGLEKVDF